MNTPLPGAGELPKQIGPYRILGLLGDGGMGRVFEALQLEPERRVALKVIRGPLATESLRRRFATEAQALACLNHPAIATIFATGTAEVRGESCPYIALERVEGQSLDSYLINETPSLSARVELLARTCDAVHHAHEKGIVHRDLKPTNVMVDTRGRPKVLDFGIARFTAEEGDVALTRTRTGQPLGTLQYMSPEQFSNQGSHVDPRSDVYSLGVLLYEALSGERPFPLDGLSPAEAARVVTRGGAPLLSSIDGRLAGDLETIAAKALETDPHRRYASAAELAADLRRFLDHEPIHARPMTTLYRLQKFTHRNRVLVAGVASTLVALGFGLLGTSVFAMRASERADQAEAAQLEATQFAADMLDAEQRALADAKAALDAEHEAERQARNASAVRELFLQMLDSARPSYARGQTMTVLEALALTGSQLADAPARDPEVEYAIHQALAHTFAVLEDLDSAVHHSRIASRVAKEHLGPASSEARASRVWLAVVLVKASQDAEAEAIFEQVVQQSADSGPDLFTYVALGHLGNLEHQRGEFARAIELSGQSLAGLREQADADPAGLMWELVRMSRHCMMTGWHERELETAQEAHALALEIGFENLTTPLDVPTQLANALDDNGRPAEALEVYEQTLAQSQQWYGENDDTLLLRFDMALALSKLERNDEASEQIRLAYRGLRDLRGQLDREVLLVVKGVLDIYGLTEQYEAGLIWMDAEVPEVPDEFMGWLVQTTRGTLLLAVGAPEEALVVTRPAFEKLSLSLPRGHAHLIAALEVLVSSTEELGRADEQRRYADLLEAHRAAARSPE